MSAAVEDRVVAMKFDNTQFEPAVKQTMSTMDKLKAALNFNNGPKANGLDQIQQTANRFSLAGMTTQIGGVSAKFLALATVATTALATITSRAVNAGLNVVKSFAITPALQGFHEYETKIGSIQTILGNTAKYGTKLPEVNKVLNQLNHYADKTIYNFGDMTKNIGLFTNAGIKVGDASKMIMGFSNAAAASGTNAEQAAGAAYQLSQALSSGTVRLMDWKSLTNANMGNKNMQTDLIAIADSMGTVSKAGTTTNDIQKNFNASLEKGWLSADVMSKYLNVMAGGYSEAKLQAMGLTKEQAHQLSVNAKNAETAATKVRTFTQLVGTVRESIGSNYSAVFEALIGNFNSATTLFTNVNNALSGKAGVITKVGNAMLSTAKSFVKWHGREALIAGVGHAFDALLAIMKPIHAAFVSIFPPATGKQLAEMAKHFAEFTKSLVIGKDTAALVKRSFAGLFAVFDIAWQLIKAVARVFGNLFDVIGGHKGDILGFTANIGDFLVHLDKVIKKGDLFYKFFVKIGNAIYGATGVMKTGEHAIVDFFNALLKDPFATIKARWAAFMNLFGGLGGIEAALGKFGAKFMTFFKAIGEKIQPFIDAVGAGFSKIGDAILAAISSGDYSGLQDVLNTTIFAGILLAVRHFMKNGLELSVGGSKGLFKGITEAFDQLTNTLKSMQSSVQAKTIMTIAIAVGILALSLVVLSMIDPKKLTSAMAGVAVSMGLLLGAMATLEKITSTKGFAKVTIIATAMVILAVAILILTASVAVLSGMSWEELAKGLGGVAVLLALIVGVSRGLGKSSANLMAAGLAMIPLAVGLKILASVVKDFSEMSWESLGKGFGSLAVGLGIITLAVRLMPKDIALKAAGLLILGAALKVIGSAISDMGGMSMAEIGKGMLVLAVSLAILAAALIVMTEGLPGAAALIVAAGALAILAPAIQKFGEMDMASIGKAMLVMFGALLILAAALIVMTGTLPGAAALLVASFALGSIGQVLQVLAKIGLPGILIGLGALAAVFIILGIAGAVLAPVVPVIVALSDALFMIGAAMLLAGLGALALGVGTLALGMGIALIAGQGMAAVGVLAAVILLIPVFMGALAAGITNFIVTLVQGEAQIIGAFTVFATAWLTAIIQLAPLIGQAFGAIMGTIISVIGTWIPKVANMGLTLIVSLLAAINSRIGMITALGMSIITKFLNGIAANIGNIVTAGTNIIVNFINGITKNQQRVLTAGANMIISFVEKLASTIRNNQARMTAAGRDLASAIISGMTGGLSDMAGRVASKARDMALSAYHAAKDALGINSPSKMFRFLGEGTGEGMIDGMDNSKTSVGKSGAAMGMAAFTAVKSTMAKMTDGLSSNIDVNPTIKPVMDLTNVTQSAGQIGKMLDKTSVAADLSYSQAVGISQTRAPVEEAAASPAAPKGDTVVKFEQTINAPVAPSPIEVYRNTKNLISMAKKEIHNS
jgi:tape measure domain-containing protein